MQIYIINLFVLGLNSLFYNVIKTKSKHAKKFFLSISIMQLLMILALRHYSIGIDIPNYLSFFRLTFYISNKHLLVHRFEIGYKILNKLVGIFTDNIQLFLSSIAIICLIPVGRFIYKHSKMPFLSIFLYIGFNYFTFNFSGLRQSIAYGIILISYDYIKNRKLAKFIIFIILASLFHTSALVFLPAYFLYKVKVNNKTIFAIIVFDLLLFAFRKPIFSYLITTFYESYAIIESDSFTWMFFCLAVVCICYVFYKKYGDFSIDYNGWLMFLIIGVSLLLFASVGDNVMRVSRFYYIFVIVAIPEALSHIKSKSFALISKCTLIIIIFILYIWFLNNDVYWIVPYKFFWQ